MSRRRRRCGSRHGRSAFSRLAWAPVCAAHAMLDAIPRASSGTAWEGFDADGSRRGQGQEPEEEVQGAARARAEEAGQRPAGPADDLRGSEAEAKRERELVIAD